MDVDGAVFLRVNACPASGCKNTDLIFVKSGKYGLVYSKYAIVNRGTSTNPDSRCEKVSVLVWQHGGFADTWTEINTFVQDVKGKSNLPGDSERRTPRWFSLLKEVRCNSANRALFE